MATVTSKGQVTIPRNVREALQLKTGDRIEFVSMGENRFEIVTVYSVTKLKGLFKAKVKRPISIEEMNAVFTKKSASPR